ncbi:type II toxin-antitoxin system YafQ family toxin [Bartonella machadoae]|nr:type II toxin-antitoxin system YafQ family toxin [Bartonella machadoae]
MFIYIVNDDRVYFDRTGMYADLFQ